MKQNIRIQRWDWLLIIGGTLAPMTGLRISKVGPAELLCFVWALRYIKIKNIEMDEMKKFFIPFLLSMLIGTLVCIVVAPKELRVSGWATWIYLAFIACTLYERIQHNSPEYNELVFDKICVFSACWYGFLYVFSLTVSRRFLGAPLWFYYRYSGGGTNPHQVAVLLCIIAFWFARCIFSGKKQIIKYAVLCAIAVFLETESQSSTGLASIFLGAFTLLIVITELCVDNTKVRTTILVVEIMLGLLVAVLFHDFIYSMVYEWIASDSNGLGRFYIWSSFGQMFVKSPIFGLGPGVHAISYTGMKEFHNSYLEIYAASGIVGFIAFLLFSGRIVAKIIRGNALLLPIVVSAYVYSIAGFAFRRLAFWVPIAFVITIAKQKSEIQPDFECKKTT